MKRYGSIINLNPDKVAEYKKLHEKVPEAIEKLIYDCNIRNYSIYFKDNMLFSYFEYVGSDYEADMKKMEQNEDNKKWWELCKPCQLPLESRRPGEWWAEMDEVWHQD